MKIVCFILSLLFCCSSYAATINVPADIGTVKGAVAIAENGDEVVIAKGTYRENNIKVYKDITICSDGSSKSIKKTIIDGGDDTIFETFGNVKIIGLIMTNSYKPVVLRGESLVSRCFFYNNKSDSVSFESDGYGRVEYCFIIEAGDDGVDIDSKKGNVTIYKNTILLCGDDGIEARLHTTSNPMRYVFKNNYIAHCGEDGIQLIDYPDVSDRVFTICRNTIIDIAMAGIGCMPDGESREDYGGSNMKERTAVYDNVITRCNVGITGAEGLRIYNNAICENINSNIKNPNGASIGYNILY